jgi:hypothetical protein
MRSRRSRRAQCDRATVNATLLQRLPQKADARNADTLVRRDGVCVSISRHDRIDVLLIEELEYIPVEREATDLLVQLISARYERRSIAITTNLPSECWTEIFP